MRYKKNIVWLSTILLIVIAIVLIGFKPWEANNEKRLNYTGEMEPRLGYVELQVSDLEQSLSFYQEIIGFKLLEKNGNSAKLTSDGKTPILTLIEESSFVERPFGTTGLFHFAILVPSREELASMLNHLIDSEYPLQGVSDHQYSEAIYLADPDFNGIEIYVDRDPDLWLEDESGGYVGGTYQLDVKDLLSEISGKEWDGLAADTRLGHMHLQVSNIEESEKFYVDALGFNVVARDSQMLFVSKDDYHHHIGMNTWAGEGLPKPPDNALGMRYYTTHFTQEEYDQAISQLTKLGFSFTEENNVITTEDPSGNQIKIILWDRI
ncbi:VOC family protein [Bacillus sp. JJ1562]|uniref:VOC family protein n=1 Tax=Bacillus sp. JJ1562 TaxID=3122960 RepID=UPI003001AFB5